MSRILSNMRRRAAGRTVVLELEPLDDGAPNLEQRRRRLAFYGRGGFRCTGYRIHEGDQSYSVMADGAFDPGAFRRLVFRFGLGLRRTFLTQE